MKSRRSLYTSSKLIKFFFCIVALIWIVPAGKLFFKGQISSGFKVLMLGIIYILAVFVVQTYFIKMIMLYQKNLDKATKNYKNKKMIKNKGGYLK